MSDNNEIDNEDLMGYGKMVEKSLKSVVRESLKKVEKDGMIGSHHFYITFNTTAKGVHVSKAIKIKYPKEMTIVLQHQYYDLEVGTSEFSVALSFNGVNEKLVIPFNAITVFADPSVNFVLQFQQIADWLFGDNLVSLRRIWTKLGGFFSYKPPGASYTPQGPQKQPEIVKNKLFMFYHKFKT